MKHQLGLCRFSFNVLVYIFIDFNLSVRYAGQVGYVVSGMRNVAEARVGDTFYRVGSPVQPLPGFKPAKPMVYVVYCLPTLTLLYVLITSNHHN